MKPIMLLRRIGMYVKWDPMTLVSMILSLLGFWGFREGEIFTNAVLLMAASIVGVRFYRERHPVLVGICALLVLYSVLMLAVALGAAPPLPWSS